MTAPAGVSGQSVVNYAAQQLGDTYDFGATGPDRWDCSSLVQWAYRQAGIDIPRVTYDQVKMPSAQAVPLDRLQPGDLVFTDWGLGPNSHVGLYAGNNKIIEAGSGGVEYEEFGPNYRAHVTAARRIAGVSGYTGPSGDGGITLPGLGLTMPSPGDVFGFIGQAAGDPLGALNRVGDAIAAGAGTLATFGQVNEKILDFFLSPRRLILKSTLFVLGLIFIIMGVWMLLREIKD